MIACWCWSIYLLPLISYIIVYRLRCMRTLEKRWCNMHLMGTIFACKLRLEILCTLSRPKRQLSKMYSVFYIFVSYSRVAIFPFSLHLFRFTALRTVKRVPENLIPWWGGMAGQKKLGLFLEHVRVDAFEPRTPIIPCILHAARRWCRTARSAIFFSLVEKEEERAQFHISSYFRHRALRLCDKLQRSWADI